MMVLDDLGWLERSSVYASDLNPDVLETARKGRYKYQFNQSYLENFEKVLPGRPWQQYMTVDRNRDAIQMKEFLCRKPRYSTIDLVREAEGLPAELDMIICRNVIIYFNQNLQNRLFERFHRYLVHQGILLLGVHESIMGPWAARFLKQDPFYRPAGPL